MLADIPMMRGQQELNTSAKGVLPETVNDYKIVLAKFYSLPNHEDASKILIYVVAISLNHVI